MHVLRQMGNEPSHESFHGTLPGPSAVAPADLTAALCCIEQLLEFWIEERSHLSTV
jgi:hypothetical protein